MSLLELDRVSHHARDGRARVAVLKQVSLYIEEGDFIGIWGMRRCGKTTLLRIVCGIERPDQGTVRFGGREIWTLTHRARVQLRATGGVAYVPSTLPTPTSSGSALEEASFGALCAGANLQEARRRARRIFELLGAEEILTLPLERLSAAERLRVALVGALARSPRLLVIDAPELLADAIERNRLYALLASLRGKQDLAILIAAEDLDALNNCTRYFTLGGGYLRAVEDRGRVIAFPTQRSA
jgi:predicted ABC-type transport system involved in lysophospholipase L1 biosynthesis ATPase subunit